MAWANETSGDAVSETKLKMMEKSQFQKDQTEWNKKYNHLQETLDRSDDSRSRLVLGIWGEPWTCKTSVALDFPDDIIYVLDWDNGVESIWRQHHDCTDRIELYNPLVLKEDGVIDIEASEDNSARFVTKVKAKIADGEKPVFVMDGVDAWYAACLLKVNPDPRKVSRMQPWKYGERNKVFYFLMKAIYNLNCDVIYVSHATEVYLDNSVVGYAPAWRDWSGMLEQEIRCYSRKKGKETKCYGELIGSRTNGSLVGTIWTIKEGVPPNIVWNGIPELRERKI